MNGLLGAIILTCTLSAAVHQAQAPGQPESHTRKAIYLVIYRPGQAWIAGKAVAEQPLKPHGQYMLSLYKKGILKFAGPFMDNAGGAVAFEAENDAAAREVIEADPAVTSHVFVAELHPWGLVDWERYIKK